ncbi:hypothetical protein [Streptomyces pseudoechinosporeus]
MSDTRTIVSWGHEALSLVIDADQDDRPRLRHLGAPGTVPRPAGSREPLPLVEAVVGGHGREPVEPAPGRQRRRAAALPRPRRPA